MATLWVITNQPEHGAGRPKCGNPAVGGPDLASQLYGLRSGLLRYGQLPGRTRAQSIWALGVNDVIGTNCKPCLQYVPGSGWGG